MSDTPRTDESIVTVYKYGHGEKFEDKWIPPAVARQLERELATVTAERDRLREALQDILIEADYPDCDVYSVRSLARAALGVLDSR